ncbi:MAG TPA: PASTA domain-containing protein, partial [Acidimicrobiales bacterium]|nr:PASTA domain-containing protein [Acidimicrobiales bacterium]
RAAAPQAAARLDAAGFAARLGALASALPSPDPLPLLTPRHEAQAPISGFRPPGVSELTQVAPALAPVTGPAAPVGTRAGPGEIFDAEPLGPQSSHLPPAGGPTIATRGRSRRKLAWTIGIVAAVLLLAAGTLVAVDAKVFTPSHPAPALVDLTMAGARAAAARDHFTLHVETPVRSISVAKGSIISQSPSAGTSLKEGSTLNVVPSKGPPPVAVPSLTGMTCPQAIAALEAAHLKGSCAPPRYDNNTPAGQLIIWSIDATSNPNRAPYGSTITLVPSEGHAPVPVPVLPSTYTFDQALAALQAVGLTATQASDSSATVPAGQIISTSPASGAMAPYGSAVTVTVSTGPAMVAVPNVTDDTVSQATSVLQGAGLTVSGVTGSPNGLVKRTDPPQDTSVPSGSSVQIYTR